MLQPSDYFNLAITLHKSNRISVILRNNDITPDAAKTRTPKEIVEAIKNHTGKESQLVCDISKTLLVEVRIFFEKNNKSNYRNCPAPTKNTCEKVVYCPI
jgi:ribonuclease I